jgi:hypothetical protein
VCGHAVNGREAVVARGAAADAVGGVDRDQGRRDWLDAAAAAARQRVSEININCSQLNSAIILFSCDQ